MNLTNISLRNLCSLHKDITITYQGGKQYIQFGNMRGSKKLIDQGNQDLLIYRDMFILLKDVLRG